MTFILKKDLECLFSYYHLVVGVHSSLICILLYNEMNLVSKNFLIE
jgi:hypothetical protein